jgi:hypothetical protein
MHINAKLYETTPVRTIVKRMSKATFFVAKLSHLKGACM